GHRLVLLPLGDRRPLAHPLDPRRLMAAHPAAPVPRRARALAATRPPGRPGRLRAPPGGGRPVLTLYDEFAGVGGSSWGATRVPGVQVILAANHWQTAVDSH